MAISKIFADWCNWVYFAPVKDIYEARIYIPRAGRTVLRDG